MRTSLCCFFISCLALSRVIAQDTILIEELRLQSQLREQPVFRSPAAAAVIDSSQLSLAAVSALTAAVNSAPGVRMEERSPGSYRLSIRGSLIRSPFGIRNVKVYLDDLPLTDAGGNTYLNILPPAAIQRIEILKGPDGSLYGANSGGVVNLRTDGRKELFSAGLGGGSYGLFKQNLSLARDIGKHRLSLYEDYQRSDGYRAHSKLNRLYVQASDQWRYSARGSLNLLVLYSKLAYQTPGGLTESQYLADPRLARPATATLPGATQQDAGVYNDMLFGGITHKYVISEKLQHVLSIFGSAVDFKNPFISNYEMRQENTIGGRSFFVLKNRRADARLHVEYAVGAEWQQTNSTIRNYTNLRGEKGSLTAAGKIITDQYFIFNRLVIDIAKKLLLEAGISYNGYAYSFSDSARLRNRFTPQWMPRLAASYTVIPQVSLRASVSRGYSTPTTAEIRPSDNNLYSNLEPETGNNLEAGIRFRDGLRALIDVSVFSYSLRNTIVRQQHPNGDEYFINAGKTKQRGLELQTSFRLFSNATATRGLKTIRIGNSSTLSHFIFRDYMSASGDFSGNRLTGVPQYVFVSHVISETAKGFYLFAQYNHTSRLPLDDANLFYAKAYDLVQVKLGLERSIRKIKYNLYAGVDNLLNENYSAGNDLNAAGNRFYNAAAKRNYVAGIILQCF